MYQISIYNNEPVFLEYLSILITKIMLSLDIPCRIHTFQNAKELTDFFTEGNYPPRAHLNLLLLDFVLEKENNVQLAEHDPLKPLDQTSFSETLKLAYKNYRKNIMVIDTPSQTISFRLDEVLYIDIYDKTLSVHLQNGSVLTAMANLSSLLKKLPPEQFVQCHRSYIVSLPAISSLCRYTIKLKNQEIIPVSKKRYKNVQNALLKNCM